MNATARKIPLAWRQRARDLLVQALYQWQLAAADPTQVEAEFRADNGRKTDWDFFHQAFVHVTSHAAELAELYLPHLDREQAKLDPVERGILLLGVYELSQRIDVPYRVVINEYVELAKKYGASESHKYVNGILDKAARKLRALELGQPA